MKAYSDGTATPKQKIFNTKLSLTRMVIERSFGKLKGRWGILLKYCDAHLRNMIQIIQTWFILQNVCEEFNSYWNMEINQNLAQLTCEDIS